METSDESAQIGPELMFRWGSRWGKIGELALAMLQMPDGDSVDIIRIPVEYWELAKRYLASRQGLPEIDALDCIPYEMTTLAITAYTGRIVEAIIPGRNDEPELIRGGAYLDIVFEWQHRAEEVNSV